jgi:Ser-tRNA(Ala) deacylase AlaX
MTVLLYHTDAYQRECIATVLAHDESGTSVILDTRRSVTPQAVASPTTQA